MERRTTGRLSAVTKQMGGADRGHGNQFGKRSLKLTAGKRKKQGE